MFKKIAISAVSVLALASISTVYADNERCSIEVAVATPPIAFMQNVAFNVVNDQGISRSVTLHGGSAPVRISDLPCSDSPYVVSATTYFVPAYQGLTPFSDCILKSENGLVWLRGQNSSVSIVFPNDFQCR